MSDYREKFWNDIPVGRENAVHYGALCARWGMNERLVRKMLQELSYYDSGDDYILIRSSNTKGFYKTDDHEEMKAYKRECLSKGRSVFAPVKKINRILSASGEQLSLINNLRAYREAKGMKQNDVVLKMQLLGFDIDKPLLSRMENSVVFPTPTTLAGFAQIYECKPFELIGEELY